MFRAGTQKTSAKNEEGVPARGPLRANTNHPVSFDETRPTPGLRDSL